MMGHPDASTPEPRPQGESRVTLDEATNEHYSIIFIEEEGAPSNFQGVPEAIDARRLFSALYPDRGNHYECRKPAANWRTVRDGAIAAR
jgi:hypothetical protein